MSKRNIIGSLLLVAGLVALLGTAWYWGSAGDLRIQPGTLSQGETHNCAIATDGNVVCWGTQGSNELATEDRRIRTYGPVRVDLDEAPTAVTAGKNQSCATLESGRLSCWGIVGVYPGVFPDPSLTTRDNEMGGISGGPYVASGIEGAIDVGLGFGDICTLDGDGRVTCFRQNQAPTAIENLDDAVSLSVSRSHACALRANGSAACWGNNGQNQFGQDGPDSPGAAVAVPDVSDLVEIAVFANSTCAITSTDALWCWGGFRTEPSLITDESVIAVNEQLCIAQPDGAVKCLQSERDGDLQWYPAVDGITDAVRLTSNAAEELSSRRMSCAEQADGRVACWGIAPRDAPTLGDAANRDRSTSAVIVADRGYTNRLRWQWRIPAALAAIAGIVVLAQPLKRSSRRKADRNQRDLAATKIVGFKDEPASLE